MSNTLDNKLEDSKVSSDFKEAIFTQPTEDCRTYLNYEKDNVISRTVQNTLAIEKTNAKLRENDLWSKQGDFKMYARIPRVLWLHWESLGITQDDKALMNAIELFKNHVKVTNRRF